MLTLFLMALGLNYLQNKCNHPDLWRDGTTIRCRGCSKIWKWDGGPEPFPTNWEPSVREAIEEENRGK